MARIYVSGGFYGSYKETIYEGIDTKKHEIIDPEARSVRPRVPGFYVGDDLQDINTSQIVLAVQTPYPYLYGMAAEAGFAVGLVFACLQFGHEPSLDVIYVCLTGRVDSFLSGLARATFTNLEDAIAFINDRYD